MKQDTLGALRRKGWNVFQHNKDRELWCAVSPYQQIPRFLFSGGWHFSASDGDAPIVLPEFRETIAEHAVRLAGFYLFHRFEADLAAATADLEKDYLRGLAAEAASRQPMRSTIR